MFVDKLQRFLGSAKILRVPLKNAGHLHFGRPTFRCVDRGVLLHEIMRQLIQVRFKCRPHKRLRLERRTTFAATVQSKMDSRFLEAQSDMTFLQFIQADFLARNGDPAFLKKRSRSF